MKVFITGATGYVGQRLAMRLAEEGTVVHVLVRSTSARQVLNHPNIRVFTGDIRHPESLSAAMQGCRSVFHIAALVRWSHKDPTEFHRVNVEGTRNVLDAARNHQVESVVFTSTTGVLGPSQGRPLAEADQRITPFESEYEVTKHLAEQLVQEYSSTGLRGVIVAPSRVYGPGIDRYSNAINRFIQNFMNKRINFVPAIAEAQANYVYVDDVVEGHLLAMQRGASGEKYILGGENVTFGDFVDTIHKHTGKRSKIVRLPRPLVTGVAFAVQAGAWLINRPAPLTPKVLNRLFQNLAYSSDKAIQDLGYSFTPFDEGIRKTVVFLRQRD